MEPEYTVRLEVFEGPLDLLLQLIERDELDVTTVALAQVTDQFLDHLEHIPDRPADELTEFLVVAAKLLQIKSEALLPRPPEREPGEEDPAEALARQLMLYKQFKYAARELGARERAGLRTFLRLSDAPPVPEQLDLAGIGLGELRSAMLDALAGVPDDGSIEEVAEPPKVLIEDKIERVVEMLEDQDRISFRAILTGADTRLDIVVSFLAVLELFKSRRIWARQEQPFGDIELSRGPNWEAARLEEQES